MGKIGLFTLIVLSALSACRTNMGKSQDFKARLDHLEVYEIDAFATPGAEQSKEFMYLSDYQIIKPIALDDSAADELKKVISYASMYNGENIKSCPFIGKYGIALSNKDEEYLHLILSSEACPKCQIFASDTALSGSFDLSSLDMHTIISQYSKGR
ncbi:MAG: hypothetical protein EAZ89_12785 [Bacteroidetes bacterium]|nr:MAG: hypothetical protein EAZ89_12785 [Bacteroidota bacterium]